MNRTDIAHQVSITLGDHADDYDIDGIVDDLVTAHDGEIASVDDFDSESYWAIVETHYSDPEASRSSMTPRTCTAQDEEKLLRQQFDKVVKELIAERDSLRQALHKEWGAAVHAEAENVHLQKKIERLRDHVAELEAYIYGCTCCKPCTRHPQPHTEVDQG